MADPIPKVPDWATVLPTAKFVASGLVISVLVLAIGHLYVLEGLTDLFLGLPLWIWLELVVVFAMLAVAWLAVRLVAVATEGDG